MCALLWCVCVCVDVVFNFVLLNVLVSFYSKLVYNDQWWSTSLMGRSFFHQGVCLFLVNILVVLETDVSVEAETFSVLFVILPTYSSCLIFNYLCHLQCK